MQFAYEAMRPDGNTVTDLIEAGDRSGAAGALREKGLIVLRLDERAAAARSATAADRPGHGAKITTRDVILFTRQLKMLLESGAPLVPALQAAEEQSTRPAVRAIVARLRERVEEGESLCAALEAEGSLFDPVFRSMVAAGEATATLPDVFGRLCELAQRQQQTRKMVLGALLYPCILSILLVGVISILLFFVVPRFKILFTSMRSPMPATTQILFDLSGFLTRDWPYLVGGLVAAVIVIVVGVRLPGTRPAFDRLVLRLPIIGRLVSRLIFARVVRIWAAMLRCHVPLLEAIRQSKEAVTNVAFLELIAAVEESVSSGGRMGQAIAGASIADPVIVSAIKTGEENGRLAEATDFVSTWIDEDNGNLIQHVTRLAEPLMLAVMGVVVGFVAMSLFVPLFDLASAAG